MFSKSTKTEILPTILPKSEMKSANLGRKDKKRQHLPVHKISEFIHFRV